MFNTAGEEKQYQNDMLLKERAASEQHRLNYEKLKVLTIRHNLRTKFDEIETGEREILDEIELPVVISPCESKLDLPNCNGAGDSCDGPVILENSTAKSERFTREASQRNIPIVNIGLDESQKSFPPVASTRVQLLASTIPQIKCDDCAQCSRYQEERYFLMSRYKEDMWFCDKQLEMQARVAREEEKVNRELENTNMILVRNNSALKLEIETLREELEETRKKLEETTSLNATLQKGVDSDHSKIIIEKHQLQQRQMAPELRKNYNEEELSALRIKTQRMEETKQLIAESHEKEKQEMKALLVSVYNICIQENRALQNKYSEIKNILASQQKYIQEIEYFVQVREIDNDVGIEDLCGHLKKVIVDSKEAMGVIETRLRTTVSERGKLHQDLQNAAALVQKAKKDAGRHLINVTKFVNNLLRIIGGHATAQFTGQSYKFVSANVNGEVSYDSDSFREHEQDIFVQVLKQVKTWRAAQMIKMRQWEKRNEDLQNLLKSERTKLLEANEITKMNYKTRKHFAKNLKGKKRLAGAFRRGNLKYQQEPVAVAERNLITDWTEVKHIDDITHHDHDPTVNQLLQQHFNFGKILHNITSQD